MATRIGGGDNPPVMMPPAGVAVDNRSDQRREQMIKELQERDVVRSRGDAEHVVDQILRRMQPDGGGLKVAPLHPDGMEPRPGDRKPTDGSKPQVRPDQRVDAKPTPERPGADQRGRPPETRPAETRSRTEALPKAMADFQRENGLPVTGRLDAATLQALKDKGVVTTSPPSASRDAPAPQKVPVSADMQSAARKLSNAAEKPVKQRAEQHEPNKVKDAPKDAARDTPHVDAVVDPAKLIASLMTAGFLGKKQGLEDGVKAFQAMFGLPLTGKVDAQTAEAMKQQGLGGAEGPPPKHDSAEPPRQQTVKRALNEPQKSTVADKNVERDTTRAQASTKQPTTSNDIAARAPSTTASDAADQMRLDTVLAQQRASERGVQEATGDPHAVAGQGASEGQGQGVQGKGAAQGGGQGTTGAGALGPEHGPEGDESAVGNSKAGDDNFLDETRGNASAGLDADGDVEGHYQVPSLSEQVAIALAAIARDDDGNGPVTYTWDVTFYRPGIYGALQPAEEIWHVAVVRATAFDPVWTEACEAIASRMLYLEPDGTPPTPDDFVLALKRARVA